MTNGDAPPNKLYFRVWFWALNSLMAIGLGLYLTTVRPWLNGFSVDNVSIPLGIAPADTYTYWFHAVSNPLSVLPLNLLGPVSLIKIFGANFDLIFLFYVLMACYVSRELFRYKGKCILRVAVLFLANPLIMFQFFAPNKEILIILSLLLAMLYGYSGRFLHLVLGLLLAAFSKPEYFALASLFFSTRKLRPGRRLLVLGSMVLVISLVYSLMPNMSAYSEVLFSGQTEKSLGVTTFMQKLAADFSLFPIVLIPRLLLAMFEGFVGFSSANAFPAAELYILISGAGFIGVLFFAALKRRLSIEYDEVYLLCLVLLMASVIPFPHHRYVLPAYPLLLLIALGDGPKSMAFGRSSRVQNNGVNTDPAGRRL